MEQPDNGQIERSLLLHLLDHRGHQVRFEADQWTTEFGIFRAFTQVDPLVLKTALRALEITRLIYRRVQYVVGYSEPKLVYSLTPSGHRKALETRRGEDGSAGPEPTEPSGSTGVDNSARGNSGGPPEAPSLVEGS